MRKQKILPFVIFFLVLALFFFIFSQSPIIKPVTDSFAFLLQPLQKGGSILVVNALAQSGGNEDELEGAEIKILNAKERKEMQALRDQFNTPGQNPADLTPVRIVGFTGYVPGISKPIAVTIDQGSANGIKEGQVVIYKDNLVGRVDKVLPYFSSVMLLTHDDLSFTAETIGGIASGVVHGGKEGIVLDNVVLSEKVAADDVVVTKGDLTAEGIGFPPGLVVGKIKEVEKKQSDLFQKAKVESLIDADSLTTVFVLGSN